MTLLDPTYLARDHILAARPGRSERVRFTGLWVAGDLAGLTGPAVAVVGTRAPSEGGRARAAALARDLAAAGVCVVSGLALGIDGAAHAGALAGGGPTVGVLGGGHRRFFPPRNAALAEAILAAGGAVVSPFAPDEPARPWQFLQRNGVVAALADAVVIVEAAARSGALNTASWAADLGVDVLAFPGDVDRPKAAGANALIRDGATLVRDAADVLAALGLAAGPLAATPCGEVPAGRGPEARAGDERLGCALVAALDGGPLTLDDLAEAVRASAGDVLATAVDLELRGNLVRRSDGTFALPEGRRASAAASENSRRS
jgi:DNA processing protein